LDVAALFQRHRPVLYARLPKPLTRWTVAGIERLARLAEIRSFVESHAGDRGEVLLDAILEHLDVSCAVSFRDKERIPAEGRLLVVANHPLGALDGLALLKTLLQVRSDVKLVVNEWLLGIQGLAPHFLPVDAFSDRQSTTAASAIGRALEREEAVVLFPAGEVSRLTLRGVRDRAWRAGAVRLARRFSCPVLPVWVEGKNSALFYGASSIHRKASLLLLPREMFSKRGRTIHLRVGDLIPARSFAADVLKTKAETRLLHQHVLALGRGRKGPFRTEQAIAHPARPSDLLREIRRAEDLGITTDGRRILLADAGTESALLREIGRLRELTFRKVGEGTGRRLDVDRFDSHYRHLLLWDEEALEIVGAYRIGFCREVLARQGLEGLYTSGLFEFSDAFQELLPESAELGRSFVQARHWNSRALDLLWQGIGALLASRPHIRYLFGAVSISGTFPEEAKRLLVAHYGRWHGDPAFLAQSRNPYTLSRAQEADLSDILAGEDRDEDFRRLRERLKTFGCAVPTLFRQYTELCEPGGVRFLDFGIDPDFGHCVDGLILLDLHRMTRSKRERYLPSRSRPAPVEAGAAASAGASPR
jgi:putative hemolysin